MRIIFFISLIISVSQKVQSQNNHQYLTKRPYAVVLGTTQDGGYPHAGCEKMCCKEAWLSDSLRKMVASIAIIDPRTGLAWMIDATPDFAKQYHIITKKHNILDGTRIRKIILYVNLHYNCSRLTCIIK